MKHIRLPRILRQRLDARGISHIGIPLAVMVVMAIGGTYMVVANRTASLANITGGTPAAKTLTTKTAKVKKTKPPKSFIVVYSDKGAYDSIKIHAFNPSGKLNCGGEVSAHDVTKSLSKSSQGLKLSCSPTTGNEGYYVYFGKNKQITNHYVAVSVNAGYCVLVHSNASLIRQVPVQGSTCVGANSEPDVPTKQDVTLTLTPKLSSNKKKVEGTITLTGTTDGMTKVECTGQVNLWHTTKKVVNNQVNAVGFTSRNFPLKFVNQGKGYCQARISNLQDMPPGYTYDLNATFTGSEYFNSADSGIAHIAIPAAKTTTSHKTPQTEVAKPLH